jgi:hypothetical protein
MPSLRDRPNRLGTVSSTGTGQLLNREVGLESLPPHPPLPPSGFSGGNSFGMQSGQNPSFGLLPGGADFRISVVLVKARFDSRSFLFSQPKLTASCGINLRSARRRRDRSDESEQARDESTSRHKRQKTGHC